jgi:hypothetical protein
MKANIRLGLAAGECVGPEPRALDRFGWKPALAMASLVLVVMSGWLLQSPQPQIENAKNGAAARDQRLVLHSTSDGIQLQQGKDRAFTVLYRAKEPALLSVNTDGSVQARYVDSYTGQVTITNVYTE